MQEGWLGCIACATHKPCAHTKKDRLSCPFTSRQCYIMMTRRSPLDSGERLQKVQGLNKNFLWTNTQWDLHTTWNTLKYLITKLESKISLKWKSSHVLPHWTSIFIHNGPIHVRSHQTLNRIANFCLHSYQWSFTSFNKSIQLDNEHQDSQWRVPHLSVDCQMTECSQFKLKILLYLNFYISFVHCLCIGIMLISNLYFKMNAPPGPDTVTFSSFFQTLG